MQKREMRNHDRLTNLVLFTLASIGLLFFAVPIASLMVGIPWHRTTEVIARREIWESLQTSMIVTGSAVVLSFLFGFPLAWIMTQHPGRATRIVRIVVLLPMVLPPVVGGVALLSAFGKSSPIGCLLDSIGIQLAFTTLGAVFAVSFVSMPFMIIMLESGLKGLDKRQSEAASVLGASKLTIIRRILIPELGPAILGGAALTWARALGEFGATIAFAGNRPGHTQTLPLAVYQALQSDMDRAVLISAMLILITASLMIFVHSRGINEH